MLRIRRRYAIAENNTHSSKHSGEEASGVSGVRDGAGGVAGEDTVDLPCLTSAALEVPVGEGVPH